MRGFVILILGFCIESVNCIDTWGHYETVVGEKKMRIAFESESIFGQSIQNEINLVGRNQLSCFNYEDGSNFAKEYRSTVGFQALNASVIYVDAEKDIMCFLVDYPEESENIQSVSTTMDIALQKIQFSNKVQDALKVDSSIYESIDSDSAALMELSEARLRSLSDSVKLNLYAPETHDSHTLYTSLALEFRLDANVNMSEKKENMVTALLQYDTSVLRRNFGVSTGRASIMNYFADAITALDTDFQHRDPCNVHAIKASLENDLVVLTLPEIGEDNVYGPMCLAYITSVCVMDEDLIQVFKYLRAETQNYRSRGIVQTGDPGNNPRATPYSAAGLTGKGQVVGVSDTGLDESSCYFYDEDNGFIERTHLNSPKRDWGRRKVVQFTYLPEADTTDVENGHGTHVCGTVAGANLGSDSEGDLYNGVAPGAKLSFMDLAYGNGGLYVPYVNELYPTHQNAGARISTNSWGSPFSGAPAYRGADVDQYLYRNPQAVILFAAGNYGYTSEHEKTITQQSSAKNVVAVGSGESTLFSDSADNIAYYSSEGPAYDGRIKPDIIAPGASLFSARSNGNKGKSCTTTAKSGTSMASPSAAGAAALIMQYFRDYRFWAKNCNSIYWFCKPIFPSGRMVKAILLHSGTGMTKKHGISADLDQYLGDPPDNVQGYGSITLSTVLPLSPKYKFDLYFHDDFGLAENSEIFYKTYVSDTSIPLKVTLVWYDPPGSPLSSKALIHDISMSMTSPKGDIYYGNGGYSYDSRNVNEQIFIQSPLKGMWKVKVFARSLPKAGFQKFTMVITCGGKTYNSKK